MAPDTSPFDDDAAPTEEIYLELRELEATVSESADATQDPSPVPSIADDPPNGLKARIARLRAILSDRGADPNA